MELTKFYRSLSLSDSLFAHPSALHGVGHTYRVMLLSLKLSESIGHPELKKSAVAAAFIHDLAREHDGYCTDHGEWAAENILPHYREKFESFGIDALALNHIKTAVKFHSVFDDPPKDHSAYMLTAVLKDSDALDRIRLSEDNLNVSFLRFEESRELINFARRLYFESRNINFFNFAEVVEFAELINQK